ncbi:N-acetylglucosamine kinase [Diaminobutyricibacter tongyongensis]|uniref:N-acetylglucosamine kinase n=1 Tax=Leifsonia tongyongensis TaxID=1268043 RepID=A0A6L9Y0X8_9MICO|nr:BadF/BadG/BcrA/BcrD ATPase family protein [Diaminobutyricibacter tongyongensis]NEN07342.1 N-acetylglucosamine kinase [Diaminobutyricibacter tongyongensis]
MSGGYPRDGVVLAVDGGGSKTDAVALDLAGNVLASARAATSSPHIIGVDATIALIDGLANEIVEQTGGRPIVQSNIYLSGLDLPAEVEAFSRSISAFPWASGATGRPAIVENDLFALLRAGTNEADAVAVVCGTGINCVGVRADGAVVRYASLGMISGDWGGGWHLGEKALWHAARAVDGRGPATSLVEAVPETFGLADVQAVIEAMHFGRLPNAELSALSPVVFRAAREGDAIAGRLVDRQAEEIVVFAEATLRKLGLLDRPTPLVLGGGVIGARDERLLSGIERGLAARAPRAHIELVTAAPILGAGLLALEAVGAGREALETARAGLSSRQASVSVSG